MRLQQQHRLGMRLAIIGLLSWMAVGQIGPLLQACLISLAGPTQVATSSACAAHSMPEEEKIPTSSCATWMACCQVRPATLPHPTPDLRLNGLSIVLLALGLGLGGLSIVFSTTLPLQQSAFRIRRSDRARRHLMLSVLLI